MSYFNIDVYSRKITTSSPDAQLWFDRGLVWTFAYHHEEAVECFRKALEHDAKYAPALLQMAEISYSKNNYLSARAYLQRYQAAAKHIPESLWLAVRTEYALGDNQAWGKYSMMLKNNFPNARQTRRLQEWESERQRRY